MLQRTKAEQVLPVYMEFLEKIPDIKSLANANEKRISQIIYPLGLAWRTKNFKQTGVDIIKKYKGVIPSNKDDLLKIRGVGEYNADSILYNVFRKRTSIIDSNIVRIIGRLFGIKTNAESRRKRIFKDIAEEILPVRKYREFNLAMLDLGALICIKNPKCNICPINMFCFFYKNKMEVV